MPKICSFCGNFIKLNYSICQDCIQKYNILITSHEDDGCGCDK